MGWRNRGADEQGVSKGAEGRGSPTGLEELQHCTQKPTEGYHAANLLQHAASFNIC